MTSAHLPRVRASELVGRGWLNTGGQTVSLGDLRGKVVLLDFWTFCCINCLHVLDELRALEARFADELVVVGVHSPKFAHEADPDALAAAVERYEVHHPVLDDPRLTTWQAYTARAWPTLVVIDPEGYVVAHLAGEGHGAALAALVEALVDEHAAKGTLRRGTAPYVPPEPTPGVLRFPAKAVALPGGDLLVADAGQHSLARLAPDGATLVRRIGSGERGWVDGGPDEARFAEPNGLCLVPDELRVRLGYDVLVADTANHLLRGVRLADGVVTTVVGTGEQYVVGGPDNVLPSPGDERAAGDVAAGARDLGSYVSVLHLDATPVAPGRPPLPGPRRHRLSSPWDVVWSAELAAFVVAMAGNHTLWAFDDEEGSITRLAGTMDEGLVDGAAQTAWFAQPSGLAVGPDGRIWVADCETSALRWLDPRTRTVHTAVGAGLFDFGHRDGPADQARLQHPLGVAALADGSILVADTYNGAVRRYTPPTGELRVGFGAPGAQNPTHNPGGGTTDRGGEVTTVAEGLAEPSGLVVTADGVLVVESAAHRITLLPSSAAAAVDRGAYTARRPVTEVAPLVELVVAFTPAPGQKADDRYGPSTTLSVSASPPELLLAGAGEDVALTRRLRFDPAVGGGVLHVTARAAACDADPAVEYPACHLASQDWGVPIRLSPTAPATLTLPLLG